MDQQQEADGALGNFLKAINDKFAGKIDESVKPVIKQTKHIKNPKSLKDNQLTEAFDIINNLKTILPKEANNKVSELLKNIEALDSRKKPEQKKILNDVLNESTTIEEALTNTSKYKLYRDRDEIFECKLSIEGSSLSHASVRLILEAEPWNLIFTGKVFTDGRCVVPLKKLSIYNEGTVGKASLEITVDGSLFIPWEETFIIEGNKKVSVEVKSQVTVKTT